MRKTNCIVLVSILSFIACERLSTVKVHLPADNPKLVAYSFFNPDSFWEVEVTNSWSIFDNEEQAIVSSSVSNATVIILENSQIVDTLLPVIEEGFHRGYRSSKKPQVGKIYELKVFVPEYESIRATSTIPTIVPIDSMSIDDIDTTYMNDNFPERNTHVKITVNFTDPEKEKNYYHLQIYRYNLDTERYYFLGISSHDLAILSEEANIEIFEDDYGSGYVIFSDELFNGKVYQLKIETTYNKYEDYTGNRLAAVLSSINEELFFYYRSLNFKGNPAEVEENPFSEPIIQFPNNIENGIGLFTGYGSSEVMVLIPEM